jgi:hypothetical protein
VKDEFRLMSWMNVSCGGKNWCDSPYHVILATCKIDTLSEVVVLLISLAPFLLLRVHCCINFFLKREE